MIEITTNTILTFVWFFTLGLIPFLFWAAHRVRSGEAGIGLLISSAVTGVLFVFYLTPLIISQGMTSLFVATYLSIGAMALIASIGVLTNGATHKGR